MSKGLLKIFIFSLFVLPLSSLYAAEPVRILLVPGHDDTSWGAQYKDIKEADMNLRLGTELFNILKKDKRFEVYTTRDSFAGYTKEFTDYFANNREQIISFRDEAKADRQYGIDTGQFIERESVPHNNASEDVSVILYGINKWANEHKINAVLHIHFNDYPRSDKWTAGKYKGFAIYTPESQMVNSLATLGLAKSVFTELKKKYAVSDYEKEKGGIIPDQSLIALGSNGTLSYFVRSFLVEYGYIYRFGNTAFRRGAYTNMANLTATGIINYFFPK